MDDKILEQNLAKLPEEMRAYFSSYIRNIECQLAEAKRIADRDGLTGLYNRRFFNRRIEAEVHRASRENLPLCLMMADIDDFKKYQDTHRQGHIGGDEAIKDVSKVLVAGLRDYDIVCRYGGDELAVICPDTNSKQGLEVASRLITSVREKLPLTISIGLSCFPEFSEGVLDLRDSVEKAFSIAKKSGKNRCVVYDSSLG